MFLNLHINVLVLLCLELLELPALNSQVNIQQIIKNLLQKISG
ncbi:MAG: hypothetical protein DID92_2727744084 [Candidatus Nitrotoga sp. SPKER]|nr:MAG: hypothetical protein DID92_2727744084 [Candidatus Nitrotoga sp. SPKER]